MTDREIQALVEAVLVQTMRDAGFESASVEAKPNHADEDALFVTVRFRSGAGVTSGHTTADALVAMRCALESKGEHRFPYLIYDYPDDPPPYAHDVLAAE
ncbi:hypothetical protein [Methylobacterium sp. Leaf118]|uniref:hypothetical protein n=1 Tax=Methylobacterium sp. Leaf118 TaxID=2876562 RepID=UPI001E42E424|nr:hypothetical protein [Methylobacterium sp. Leaf118]